MIRHIMLVETKPDVAAVELAAAKGAFMTIADKISGVDGVEWGINDSPEAKNKAYELAILLTFRDHEARQHYLDHPEHEALKVHFRKIIKNIVVFDYTL